MTSSTPASFRQRTSFVAVAARGRGGAVMAGEEMTSGSKLAAATTIRLVNFIFEDQLDEAKRMREERADDGTAQRDKPLFQILQENKEKKDAEFNERFKHMYYGNFASSVISQNNTNNTFLKNVGIPMKYTSVNQL